MSRGLGDVYKRQVATAVGLLAAIPALIAYNQFSKKLDNLINGSLAFAEQLIMQMNRK